MTERVIVLGGGMIGLSACLALARAYIPVTLLEARKPEIAFDLSQPTAWVSALNPSTIGFIRELGVWEALPTAAKTVFRVLDLADSGTGNHWNFDAADVGRGNLGHIVRNDALKSVLWEAVLACDQIEVKAPVVTESLLASDNKVSVRLENGEQVTGACAIGADGAHSWVREQAEIEVRERPYGQSAFVAVVQMEEAHHHRAYQTFLPTGPVGLLPLDDPYQCVMVWSVDQARVDEWTSRSSEEMAMELTNAFDARLGLIRVVTPPRSRELVMRHAERYVQPRLALVGDAAHTIHPLAGQGANCGFLDAKVLADCLCAAKNKNALGHLRYLRQYERQRKVKNQCMSFGMRVVGDIFSNDSMLGLSARGWGLSLLQRFPFLKKPLMKMVR